MSQPLKLCIRTYMLQQLKRINISVKIEMDYRVRNIRQTFHF
jgi:hypothetical protein